MTELCRSVGGFAQAFLLIAFLFALVETALALRAKYKATKTMPVPSADQVAADPDKWAKFLEALTKLLLALKDLPAWIAIFLAGIALVWTAGSVPPQLCAP